MAYPEYVVTCSECGHLHFLGDGRYGRYIRCPLTSEGCDCPENTDEVLLP